LRVIDADERRWAATAHLCGLLWLSGFPFAGTIGSAVVYRAKRHLSPYVAAQTREAQNFQNTIAVLVIAILIASAVLFGAGMVSMLTTGTTGVSNQEAIGELWIVAGMASALAAVMIANVVLSIVAAVHAGLGRPFRYPIALRFLR
jgi:uncharacterized Tic20 family protein